jgi:hypothetical protein
MHPSYPPPPLSASDLERILLLAETKPKSLLVVGFPGSVLEVRHAHTTETGRMILLLQDPQCPPGRVYLLARLPPELLQSLPSDQDLVHEREQSVEE